MPKRKKIVAKSKNLRRSKFSFNHLILVALAFGLIGGLATWAALAAPGGKPGGGGGGGKGGGKGGSGTIALVMVADQNNNGSPNWGDTVTFNVQTSSTTQPNVDLTCSQNGKVVYGATTGYYDGYPWPWTQNMTLKSSSWTGGSADCTAKLYAFSGSKTSTLATLNFTANP